MPDTHVDNLKVGVSGTPGTGTATIGSAASGCRGFVAGDDGKTFSGRWTDGTAWETATGCVYTHSGTTLSRGTRKESSTGSAISLTSAAVFECSPVADFGNKVEKLWASGFNAYADGTNTQNLTTGTGTTLIHGGSGGALKIEEFDIEGWFTQSTGIFFPQEAGLWVLGASAVIDSMNDGKYMAVYISHSTDGSSWSDTDDKACIAWRGASSAAALTLGGSGAFIVSANGTTDRWALRVFHNDTGTPKVPAAAANRPWCRFWGHRAGATS